MLKKLFVLSMVFDFMVSVSLGYTQQTAVLRKDKKNTSTEESQQDLAKKEGYVSLDLRDADIRNVFKILSLKSGVNIVASPEVTGLITIKLENVPWDQALDVILKTHGYAYEKKGNIILVMTVKEMKKSREDAAILAEQEPLETQTFTLNFAKASDIISSIDKIKSERGNVNYDERTNTLIVTDTKRKLQLIASVIKKLDTVTPQVLIEAKIMQTDLNDSENLGIDWTARVTLSGAQRPTVWPFTKSSDNKYIPDPFVGPDTTEGSSNTEFTYGTLNFTQLQAVLEMLKSRTDTNILSNPKIVTLDNQQANIKVAVDYPIPEFEPNKETGELKRVGVSYRPVGITFQVTPHVNNAGYVTLDLIPEVSETAGSVAFENIMIPLVNTERAETRVMIKDGDTLVIGGLITSKKIKVKKKFPLLGSIPVLGLIFQKTENSVAKKDLIVFITPHIVTPKLPTDTK